MTVPEVPSLPSVDELLATARQNDPELAAIVELLMRRQDEAGPAREPDPYADPYASAPTTRETAARDEELALLRRRNDTLAAGTGACHLCWGDDLLCPLCAGRGSPGWQTPDPWAHQRYIAPIRPAEEGSES
ncbi:hypothetical protein [Streptomyces sp. NPDC093568]|uniref:hypothetical protein n=1 Tax=Streptomyces sp. NPDC093568 TaxID=3366041 RepID=UPI0037FA52DA